MAHEPDVARRVSSRVALQLSGHTHGGQVRLMGWSPIAPSGQQLAYGHIRMSCDVVVSGGLGCSLMPFRLGVPPEIVLVTRRGRVGGGVVRAECSCAFSAALILRKAILSSAIRELRQIHYHIDGEIRDGRHHMQIRVYYEDTDFSGIVYHANYLLHGGAPIISG
jgi:hypothetical protein